MFLSSSSQDGFLAMWWRRAGEAPASGWGSRTLFGTRRGALALLKSGGRHQDGRAAAILEHEWPDSLAPQNIPGTNSFNSLSRWSRAGAARALAAHRLPATRADEHRVTVAANED